MQSSYHDHCHHSSEENHNKKRVDNRKPVYLITISIIHRKIYIPTRSPFHFAWFPINIVSKDCILLLVVFLEKGALLNIIALKAFSLFFFFFLLFIYTLDSFELHLPILCLVSMEPCHR